MVEIEFAKWDRFFILIGPEYNMEVIVGSLPLSVYRIWDAGTVDVMERDIESA